MIGSTILKIQRHVEIAGHGWAAMAQKLFDATGATPDGRAGRARRSDGEPAPFRRLQIFGLRQVEFRPMNAVVKDTLFAARQHLFALFGEEREHSRDFRLGERHGSLSLRRDLKHRQHERLIVVNRHRPTSKC